MKALKLAKTALAALTICAGAAQASPVIAFWGVIDWATFTAFAPSGAPKPVASAPLNTLGLYDPFGQAGQPTQLHWGVPVNTFQSGLIIENLSPVFAPNGVPTTTLNITHDNFIITQSTDALQTATIFAGLAFAPLSVPALGTPFLGAANFSITFTETLNSGAAGVCADGTSTGDAVNVGGCRDIFTINQTSPANFSFFFDSDLLFGPDLNGYDPVEYQVAFSAPGFGPLTPAACAAAGALPGCVGFLTQENKSNLVPFQITITAVPEPGSLALMGGALAALAWIGRRRSKNQA